MLPVALPGLDSTCPLILTREGDGAGFGSLCEFEDGDDIFYNTSKLNRVISNHLDKNPFSNNADWGGGYVWNLKKDDDFTGTFLYLGDDELVVIKRRLVDDEYYDQELKSITNSRELYKFLLSFIRNKK